MYKECASCNKRCVPLDLINSIVSTEWSEWIYIYESYEKDKKKIIVKKISKEKINAPINVLANKFQKMDILKNIFIIFESSMKHTDAVLTI